MRLIWCVFLAALFLTVAASTVWAESKPDPTSGFGHQLTAHPLLCANFEQKKILKALNRPLISKGRLVFMKGRGVLWQVTEPFPAKVLVKENELIKWDETNTPKRLSYAQSPLFRAFAQVFLSLFNGDMSALNASFNVVPVQTGEDWRLTLSSKDPRLTKIISKIRVTGGKFVENVIIDEARGDQTMIYFSTINGTTCKLQETEKASFAF